LYKQHQARAAQKLELKKANAMLVYNMLQDMRHLIILDLRPKTDYDRHHIRKAIHVEMATLTKSLTQAYIHNKHSLYEGDDLRRVLVIVSDQNAKIVEEAVISAD
jgi:rhodanese-related sulfurtransferase